MRESRYLTTKSYILDYKTIREIDRSFIFISPDIGINTATAFGAEKLKSRFCPVIQPFVKATLFLNKNPKNNLFKLDDIKDVDCNDFIKKDIKLIYLVSFYNELLINSYIENSEFKSYFYLLDYSIEILRDYNDIVKSFLFFVIKFIYLNGYKFDLTNCNNCKKSSNLYFFDLKNSGIFCDNCAKEREIILSEYSVSIFNIFFDTKFFEIKKFNFKKNIIFELLPLFKKFLINIFGKELKTIKNLDNIFKKEVIL